MRAKRQTHGGDPDIAYRERVMNSPVLKDVEINQNFGSRTSNLPNYSSPEELKFVYRDFHGTWR